MYRYEPHPGSPWVAEAVTRVMAFERQAAPIRPLPFPKSGDLRRGILSAIAEHRVVELLSPHLEELGLDRVFAKVVRDWRKQLASDALRLVVDTNHVSNLLNSHDIEHLVVKGVALSAILGSDLTRRGAGDVDIWVRPIDVARTEHVLHESGWSRIGLELPRPSDGWRWRAFLRLANELPQHSENANPIDLHWRLTPFAGELEPAFDEVYSRSVAAPGLAEGVRTLCATDALRHLAQHGRKDVFATLRHLVDIVRVADRCDPKELAALAAGEPNIALALAVASHVAGSLETGATTDRHIQGLAREAWTSCLSLQNPWKVRGQANGLNGFAIRARYEGWMFRSAPTATTRLSGAVQLAVPRRWLVHLGRSSR